MISNNLEDTLHKNVYPVPREFHQQIVYSTCTVIEYILYYAMRL